MNKRFFNLCFITSFLLLIFESSAVLHVRIECEATHSLLESQSNKIDNQIEQWFANNYTKVNYKHSVSNVLYQFTFPNKEKILGYQVIQGHGSVLQTDSHIYFLVEKENELYCVQVNFSELFLSSGVIIKGLEVVNTSKRSIKIRYYHPCEGFKHYYAVTLSHQDAPFREGLNCIDFRTYKIHQSGELVPLIQSESNTEISQDDSSELFSLENKKNSSVECVHCKKYDTKKDRWRANEYYCLNCITSFKMCTLPQIPSILKIRNNNRINNHLLKFGALLPVC